MMLQLPQAAVARCAGAGKAAGACSGVERCRMVLAAVAAATPPGAAAACDAGSATVELWATRRAVIGNRQHQHTQSYAAGAAGSAEVVRHHAERVPWTQACAIETRSVAPAWAHAACLVMAGAHQCVCMLSLHVPAGHVSGVGCKLPPCRLWLVMARAVLCC